MLKHRCQKPMNEVLVICCFVTVFTDVSFMPCIAVYMLFTVLADNQGLVILNQAYS